MDPSESLHKPEIRSALRARRRQFSPESLRLISDEIGQRVLHLPEFLQSRHIFCYVGVLTHGELDTSPLIDAFITSGRRVAAPVVTSDGKQGRAPAMIAVEVDATATFVPGRWNIPEPPGKNAFDEDMLDLSIVPALGVSLNGHRIGKGKGYYDRFLASAGGLRVCLCPESCLVPPFFADKHDVRMDLIVTERRVVRIV